MDYICFVIFLGVCVDFVSKDVSRDAVRIKNGRCAT